jgi:hypothetical protein
MVKNQKAGFLSLLAIAFLASCNTQTLVQPQQAERRVIGVVSVDFSLENNVLVSKAKFSGTGSLGVQVGPSQTAFPDNAVGIERIFAGRTDYNRTQQRFLFSTFKLTNNSGSAFNNLTFYGIERGALSIGGTPFTALRKEDGTTVADPVTRAREIRPNHGMQIDTATLSLQVDPTKADFQAISSAESDAIEAIIPPSLVTAKGITDVLDYGFVARKPDGVGNKRLIPAGQAGQFTVSFNFPLQTLPFDSVALWTWQFLVVDEPVTRVTRSLEEGTNTANAANRAQDTGVLGAEVALMGRSLAAIPTSITASNAPNTMFDTTTANLKQLPFNQVRVATFPTFISDAGTIWVQANASLGGNGSSGLPFRTIQEGIDASETGDVVRVRKGAYPDAVNIDEGIQVLGPASGTDGRDPSRCVVGTEPSCSDDATVTGLVQVTASSAAKLSGFRFVNNTFSNTTLRSVISITNANAHMVENNVFYRNGTNPPEIPSCVHPTCMQADSGVRAFNISPSVSGSLTIQKNRIVGDATNPYAGTTTALFRNKAWERGIWDNGGGYTATIKDNTTVLARTGINLESPTTAYVFTGNTFTDNGTAIAYGLVPVGMTLGDTAFVLSPSPLFAPTLLNIRNPVTNNELTVSPSTNTLNGITPNAMTLAERFTLEDLIVHRTDKGCGVLARVIPNQLFITPNSFDGGGCGATTSANIQRAIDVPSTGDTVQIKAGTYVNQLNIAENISFVGEGATTIIESPAGAALQINGGTSNNANLVNITSGTVGFDMLKVKGPHTRGAGSCASTMKLNRGVSISGGTVTITNSFVDQIRDTALFNCTNQGVAIHVGAGSLNLSGSEVTNFQSTGVFVTGATSSATIDDNLIKGNTTNSVTSRGVEVASGGAATITNNSIEDAICPSCTGQDVGIGVLVRTTGLVTITGNSIKNNDVGVNARGSGLNAVVNSNILEANLSTGAKFFADQGIGAVPASGSVAFNTNVITGPSPAAASVCFQATTGLGAVASLSVIGTGNKISGCATGMQLTDTNPVGGLVGDSFVINLSLTSGNLNASGFDLINVDNPAPNLVNTWWEAVSPVSPTNIPTLSGLANTAPLAAAPF